MAETFQATSGEVVYEYADVSEFIGGRLLKVDNLKIDAEVVGAVHDKREHTLVLKLKTDKGRVWMAFEVAKNVRHCVLTFRF